MTKQVRIAARLTGKDAERWLKMIESIESRIGPVVEAEIVREVVGLRPLRKVLPEELEYLSGKRDTLPERKDRGGGSRAGDLILPSGKVVRRR